MGKMDTSLTHAMLIMVHLTDGEDRFKGNLIASGVFSVKSMYNDLLSGHMVSLKKHIWKLKVPLNIKIFMWFLHKKVILAKVNLVKRNWNGSTKCCFCDQEETIHHLFISCPFTKLIWKIVYMTFNIPPPLNITNLFGKWLNGVNKKVKLTLELEYMLCFGQYGRCEIIAFLTKKKVSIIFAGYSFGYPLDPYVVLSSVQRRSVLPWILGATD
jgi:hypothetical protein